jgi:hypothetical protein
MDVTAPVHILALTWIDLPAQLGAIFYFIVLPLLLLVGIGCLLQRTLGLDILTLRRLNFYFVMPGIIFCSLVQAQFRAGDVVTVVAFALALQLVLGSLTWLLSVARRVPPGQRNAMVMTTIYYNSGNFGLPLQDLAFHAVGQSAFAQTQQVFVMATQNLTNFTFGIILATGGGKRQSWRRNLGHMLRLPPVWVLLAAFVTIGLRDALADVDWVETAVQPFWKTLLYVQNAFIGIALLTLGAQLAYVGPRAARHEGPRGAHADATADGPRYPVAWSVALRLLGGPAVAVGLVYAFGLTGLLAQVLLISSASPTAINCMLLCMEFDNHPDFAARAVLYSTLLSPITVTLVVFFAQSHVLPGF